MAKSKREKPTNMAVMIIIAVAVIAVIIAGLWMLGGKPEPQKQEAVAPAPAEPMPVKQQPLIDYNELGKDQEDRRKAYGVDQGVDMIVKSDESVRIGDETVSMKEIEKKIQVKEGTITEKDLLAGQEGDGEVYGIYVVQPGDNIWNIHYRLLKAYLAGKGVDLEPMADEPVDNGTSSGVGKLLKFSEQMVHIYNIKDRRLDTNLDVILPMSKIVIYNMNRVFELLDQINYDRVDLIRFDGENIWVPAEE